jgi:hypothetical protein
MRLLYTHFSLFSVTSLCPQDAGQFDFLFCVLILIILLLFLYLSLLLCFTYFLLPSLCFFPLVLFCFFYIIFFIFFLSLFLCLWVCSASFLFFKIYSYACDCALPMSVTFTSNYKYFMNLK